MKNVKLCAIAAIMAVRICAPAHAETDTASESWGSWESKQKQQDAFFDLQTTPEAELLETEISFATSDGGFSLFGTQLEGTPYQGLDTDPMNFDGNGIPLELSESAN